jgi:hypothetical protein
MAVNRVAMEVNKAAMEVNKATVVDNSRVATAVDSKSTGVVDTRPLHAVILGTY